MYKDLEAKDFTDEELSELAKLSSRIYKLQIESPEEQEQIDALKSELKFRIQSKKNPELKENAFGSAEEPKVK